MNWRPESERTDAPESGISSGVNSSKATNRGGWYAEHKWFWTGGKCGL